MTPYVTPRRRTVPDWTPEARDAASCGECRALAETVPDAAA